jgi:hypothetical protein
MLFRLAESVVNIAHVPKECLYCLRLPIAMSSSATVERSSLTSTSPRGCIALTTRLLNGWSAVSETGATAMSGFSSETLPTHLRQNNSR